MSGPVVRDGERAALLGDDDAQGVAALGEAERRGVPRAARAELLAGRRERQVDREALDAVAAHDDGAVVAGRARVEEREQQGLAQSAVELDAAFEVAVEGLAARHDEQRADRPGGELGQCAGDRVDRPRRRRGKPPPEAHDGDPLEEPPEVLLEDHDRHDHDDGQEALEDPGGELEADPAHHQVDRRHDPDPERREARARAPQPDDPGEDQRCDERDVEQVGDPEVAAHRPPASVRRGPPQAGDGGPVGPDSAQARGVAQAAPRRGGTLGAPEPGPGAPSGGRGEAPRSPRGRGERRGPRSAKRPHRWTARNRSTSRSTSGGSRRRSSSCS
jgi:hypothetical protein